LEADVVGEECVAFAEGSHGDVLGGPFTDAGELAQAQDGVGEIAPRVEDFRLGTHRGREPGDCRGARFGYSDSRQRVGSKLFRARENVRESVDTDAVAHESAESGDDACGKLRGSLKSDLLAEDGPHGYLEPVPRTGNSQTRAGGDERRKHRIA
jgi:hypothetical protein